MELNNKNTNNSSIKLEISSDGDKFTFKTVSGVEINEVDVKVIERTVGHNSYIENNSYTFHIGRILKEGEGIHSVTIKMVDSPKYLTSYLQLRLYIYYTTINGEKKRIIADNNKPENENGGEPIIYTSSTYLDRAKWPWSIQLDSIYRPFFFNTVLLFSGNTNNDIAQLYFSIANGCTFREEAGKYKIGDINLKITNIKSNVENDVYDLTIKNNYRNFSEIEDFTINENDDASIRDYKQNLQDAHSRGIRESGSDNKNGIYLPELNNYNYLIVKHNFVENNKIPSKSIYSGINENTQTEINVYNPEQAYKFNTSGSSLNISFIVNDGSPDNISYKTIEIEYNNINFPDDIYKSTYNNYAHYYGIHNKKRYDEIKFIRLNNEKYEQLMGILPNVSVGENQDNIKGMLNYLWNTPYYKLDITEIGSIDGEYDCFYKNIGDESYVTHILAFYQEDKNIKDSNNLIIMKLYDVYEVRQG